MSDTAVAPVPVPGPVPAPRPRADAPAPAEHAERPAGTAPADAAGSVGARLGGIDAARGVALVGMMAVHALYATDEAGRPSVASLVAGGRAAALFAVLAGVGVAFLTKRRRVEARRAPSTSAALLGRALAIGAIGLALGWTDPELAAVILPYYAVLFVAAIPLVWLPTSLLGIVGFGGAIGIPFASHVLRVGLPASLEINFGFGDLIADPLRLLTELTLTGIYPALSWVPYMAVGIMIGRLRLSSVRVAAWLAAVGATLALVALAASQLLLTFGGAAARIQADAVAHGMTPERFTEFTTLGPDGVTPPTSLWWLALSTAHSSTPFDLLHTIGTSMAVIGVMLLLAHVANPVLRPVVSLVTAPLAAAGSMTLTFYTLHVLFMNSDFDVYSPGVGYTLQVIAVLVVGLAWRATAGRGPLERFVALVSRRAGRLLARPATA